MSNKKMDASIFVISQQEIGSIFPQKEKVFKRLETHQFILESTFQETSS